MKRLLPGIFLCAVVSASMAGPNASARFGLDCNPATAAADTACAPGDAGTGFTVAVRVFGVRDLDGFAIRLAFDPSAVTFVSASPVLPGAAEQSLFAQGAAGPLLVKPTAPGTIDIAGSLGRTRTPGPSGDGILVFAQFRQLRPGTPGVTLRHGELIDTGLILDVVVDQ